MSAVSDLLATSRAAHLAYRMALQNHDTTAQKAALRQAADLRQAAHDADPSHTDPSWQDNIVTNGVLNNHDGHDDLLDFYREQLSR